MGRRVASAAVIITGYSGAVGKQQFEEIKGVNFCIIKVGLYCN